MTTITTNLGHTLRVQHGDGRVTLTATDAQAVAILHLTPAQAAALAEALHASVLANALTGGRADG